MPTLTDVELRRMEQSVRYLRDGVPEVDALDKGQWEWQLAALREAQRHLRLKHDREVLALAAEIAAEALEASRRAAEEDDRACDVPSGAGGEEHE